MHISRAASLLLNPQTQDGLGTQNQPYNSFTESLWQWASVSEKSRIETLALIIKCYLRREKIGTDQTYRKFVNILPPCFLLLLSTPTGTLKTPWGCKGLAQNRALFWSIWGFPYFGQFRVPCIAPRLESAVTPVKQCSPITLNIHRPPPLNPYFGQFTASRLL